MVKLAKRISFYTLLLPSRLVATLPSISRRASGATTTMESTSHTLKYYLLVITYHLAAWLTPLG